MISEASSSRPKVWSQGSAAIVRAASRVQDNCKGAVVRAMARSDHWRWVSMPMLAVHT